jgi:twitching motility protein PilI
MSIHSRNSPFELLSSIEQKSRTKAKGLPVSEEIKEEWLGIAFKLRNKILLAAMAEVSEIATPPALTNIPGVTPWVLGIANMRGNLLPVIDLQGLLYGENIRKDFKHQRIIVVNHLTVTAGLRVDAVFGIKHFWVDERNEKLPELDPQLYPFVTTSCKRNTEHYGVFSVAKLVESDVFMEVVT